MGQFMDMVRARVEEGFYGGHPVYDVGGDVGGEQDFLVSRLREKFGKAVRGVGYNALFIADQETESVIDALLDLTYVLRRSTYQGAVLANRLAFAFVRAVKGGVNIDLETRQRRGGAVYAQSQS